MTAIIDGTNGLTPPSWTTAGRPTSPTVGTIGWNSTLSQLECWVGGGWSLIVANTYSATYLAVAGGGGHRSRT